MQTSGSWYTDGVVVFRDRMNPDAIYQTTVPVTSVQAVEAVNLGDGEGGIIGSVAGGILTDDMWRCTRQQPPAGWQLRDFDDDLWPPARVVASRTGPPFNLDEAFQIPANASWIWAFDSPDAGEEDRVWCRSPVPERTTNCSLPTEPTMASTALTSTEPQPTTSESNTTPEAAPIFLRKGDDDTMIILAAILVPLAVLACLAIGCLPCFVAAGGVAAAGGDSSSDYSSDAESEEETFGEQQTRVGGPGSTLTGMVVENGIYGSSRMGPPIFVGGDSGVLVPNASYGRAPSHRWGAPPATGFNGYGPPGPGSRPAPRGYDFATRTPGSSYGFPPRTVTVERAYETIPGDDLVSPMRESSYPVSQGFESARRL